MIENKVHYLLLLLVTPIPVSFTIIPYGLCKYNCYETPVLTLPYYKNGHGNDS
ncbi:MAG: hypothetical protein ACJ75B_19890 [Flavisolibacter sp.]